MISSICLDMYTISWVSLFRKKVVILKMWSVMHI